MSTAELELLHPCVSQAKFGTKLLPGERHVTFLNVHMFGEHDGYIGNINQLWC